MAKKEEKQGNLTFRFNHMLEHFEKKAENGIEVSLANEREKKVFHLGIYVALREVDNLIHDGDFSRDFYELSVDEVYEDLH